jgi:hypothetical protein
MLQALDVEKKFVFAVFSAMIGNGVSSSSFKKILVEYYFSSIKRELTPFIII